MRLLKQAENVPPRSARAFGAIFFFFQNAKVIRRVAPAFRKRNLVIEFVFSAIKFFSGFTLPFLNLFTTNRLRNSPLTRWTHCKNRDHYECRDDWSSSLIGRIRASHEVSGTAENSSNQKITKVVDRVLSPTIDAAQQHEPKNNRYRKDSNLLLRERRRLRRRQRRNRGIDLRTSSPEGKFGSTQVSLFRLWNVNAAMLAIA